MQAIPVLLAIIVAIVVFLTVATVLEGPIVQGLTRRWPSFTYDGGSVLVVSLMVLAAFTFGLLVMYALR